MKQCFICILLSFPLLVLSCVEATLSPFASKRPVAIVPASEVAVRRIDKCFITYSWANSARYFTIAPQLEEFEMPFKRWMDASQGRLTFTLAGSTERADLRFAFSDTTAFASTYSGPGFFPHDIAELSRCFVLEDGAYLVLLDNNYRWEKESIQRALMFHIGLFLGLPPSVNPKSVLYPGASQIVPDFTKDDLDLVRQLYNRPCDEWIKLNNLPFQYYSTISVNAAFSLKGKGYLQLGYGDGFWEYDPATDRWTPRTTIPLATANRQLAYFTIKDNAFMGIDRGWYPEELENQNDRPDRAFFKYTPAAGTQTDRWTPIAPLPYRSVGPYWSKTGFELEGKGYIFTDKLVAGSLDSLYNSSVWEYNVENDQWNMPEKFLLESGSYGFSSSIYASSANGKAYIIPNSSYHPSLAFDPKADRVWSEIPAPPQTSSFYASQVFTVRDYCYFLTQDHSFNTFISRYDPVVGWQKMKDINLAARILFCFVTNDIVYVGTNDGSFRAYTP